MAKILKTEAQENALKEVAQHIKTLRKLKDFSDLAERDYRVIITASSSGGESARYSFNPGDGVVRDFIANHYKTIIKRVLKLSMDHKIEFDENEQQLISQE